MFQLEGEKGGNEVDINLCEKDSTAVCRLPHSPPNADDTNLKIHFYVLTSKSAH